jgi:hypothetical protein
MSSVITRSRRVLEHMARHLVRLAPGCAHVVDVQLRRIESNGTLPNWCLADTTPPLQPSAMIEAHEAVEGLANVFLMRD